MTFGTLLRLFSMIGGFATVIFLVGSQFALHYMDLYLSSKRGQWANLDEQSDFSAFAWATLQMIAVFFLAFAADFLIKWMLALRISELSQRVHD